MANIVCFYDESTIQTLANNDSPEFVGVPTTSKNASTDPMMITTKQADDYMKQALEDFLNTRTKTSTNGTITGLSPNKRYLVCIYGLVNTVQNSAIGKIGYVAVTDSTGNNVLAYTDKDAINIPYPKGFFPQSANIIVEKVPENGTIKGYVNYGASKIAASYMFALRLS
jgi:hypothetical protein